MILQGLGLNAGQVVQRGCGISILGDFQNSPAPDHDQPSLISKLSPLGWEPQSPQTSKISFQTEFLCDSTIRSFPT